MTDALVLGSHRFSSRLFTGTGKYADFATMKAALEASGSEVGTVAVRRLGIQNPHAIRMILETVKVPVIVDAGVGTASDVAVAMELGCHGVLLNTGIALAKDPVRMARAMKLACEAGRDAFLAGRMAKKDY